MIASWLVEKQNTAKTTVEWIWFVNLSKRQNKMTTSLSFVFSNSVHHSDVHLFFNLVYVFSIAESVKLLKKLPLPSTSKQIQVANIKQSQQRLETISTMLH